MGVIDVQKATKDFQDLADQMSSDSADLEDARDEAQQAASAAQGVDGYVSQPNDEGNLPPASDHNGEQWVVAEDSSGRVNAVYESDGASWSFIGVSLLDDSQKGVSNGVASLDGSSKVPYKQLSTRARRPQNLLPSDYKNYSDPQKFADVGTLVHEYLCDENGGSTLVDRITGDDMTLEGNYTWTSDGPRFDDATGGAKVANPQFMDAYPIAFVADVNIYDLGPNSTIVSYAVDEYNPRPDGLHLNVSGSSPNYTFGISAGDGTALNEVETQPIEESQPVPATIMGYFLDQNRMYCKFNGIECALDTSQPFQSDWTTLAVGLGDKDNKFTLRRLSVYTSDPRDYYAFIRQQHEEADWTSTDMPDLPGRVITRDGHNQSYVNFSRNALPGHTSRVFDGVLHEVAASVTTRGFYQISLRTEDTEWFSWRRYGSDTDLIINSSPTTSYSPGTDNHNKAAVLFDQDDRLWMFYNMHTTKLLAAQTAEAFPDWSQGELVERRGDMDGLGSIPTDSVSYPYLFHGENDKLCFLFRDGTSGNGDTYILRLAESFPPRWEPFASGQPMIYNGTAHTTTYSFYHIGQTPIVDSNGALHLVGSFRETGDTSTDYYIAYVKINPDGTAEAADGTAISLPIVDPNDADIVDPSDPASGFNENQGIALDSSGNPHIAYQISDPHHAYWDGSQWVVQTLASSVRGNSQLLADGDRMYRFGTDSNSIVAWTDTPPYDDWSEIQLTRALDTPSRYITTPHVDRQRWQREKVASIMLNTWNRNSDRELEAHLPIFQVTESF